MRSRYCGYNGSHSATDSRIVSGNSDSNAPCTGCARSFAASTRWRTSLIRFSSSNSTSKPVALMSKIIATTSVLVVIPKPESRPHAPASPSRPNTMANKPGGSRASHGRPVPMGVTVAVGGLVLIDFTLAV